MKANYDKLVTLVDLPSDKEEDNIEEDKSKRASNREYF